MSASSHPGLALPKGNRALDKAAREADQKRIDRQQIAKVRKRSSGRCEVLEWKMAWTLDKLLPYRCERRAVGEPHHLIGGFGRRNVGKSILAEHRIAICAKCHRAIHDRILEPSSEDAATVTFSRRR